MGKDGAKEKGGSWVICIRIGDVFLISEEGGMNCIVKSSVRCKSTCRERTCERVWDCESTPSFALLSSVRPLSRGLSLVVGWCHWNH